MDASLAALGVSAVQRLVVSLMRYSQEATMEVTQIAACNRLDDVEKRLARWLLMSYDRIGSDHHKEPVARWHGCEVACPESVCPLFVRSLSVLR